MPTAQNSDLKGKRMIRLSVRSWTNNIARGKGDIRPKYAWSSRVIKVK